MLTLYVSSFSFLAFSFAPVSFTVSLVGSTFGTGAFSETFSAFLSFVTVFVCFLASGLTTLSSISCISTDFSCFWGISTVKFSKSPMIFAR